MKVFITGIAGFVGSHVADTLQSAGHDVSGVDNLSTGKGMNLSPFMEMGGRYTLLDIQTVQMIALIEELSPDVIVHLAAQAAISTSIENPTHDLRVNGIGTINVIEAAIRSGVKRFVLASTSAVYSDKWTATSPIQEHYQLGPNTPYGISKLAAEGYVRTLFPDSCILRFGNIIGPRQVPIGENQVLSRMIRHFKYGDKFYIHGSGHQKRDFIYVSDVVSAVIAALDGEPGTYNIASGEAHSVDEMAQIVELAYGVPGYKWDHTEQEDPRAYVCLDIRSAKQGLGWEPKVKFEQAVKQTIDWWDQQK